MPSDDHQHRSRDRARAARAVAGSGATSAGCIIACSAVAACLRPRLRLVVVDHRVEVVLARRVRLEVVRRRQHLVAALAEQVRRVGRNAGDAAAVQHGDGHRRHGRRLLLELAAERGGVRRLRRLDVGIRKVCDRLLDLVLRRACSRGRRRRCRSCPGRRARPAGRRRRARSCRPACPAACRPPSATSMLLVIALTRLGTLNGEKLVLTCSRNERTNACCRATRWRSSSVWRKRTKSSACWPRQLLIAGLQVDVREVVQVRAGVPVVVAPVDVHPDAAELVDDLLEAVEVDGDQVVDRQAGQLADRQRASPSSRSASTRS